MPYGYAITGYGTGERDLFVLAVDLSGNVLWCKRYGTNGVAEFLPRTVTPNAVAVGGDILFTGTQEATGDRNIIYARINASGNIDCAISQSVEVVTTSVPPFTHDLVPVEYPDVAAFQTSSPTTTGHSLPDACAALSVDIGPDQFACDPVELNATLPGATFLWSTGSTSSQIMVSEPDTVWIKAILGCCSYTDTAIIHLDSPPTAAIQLEDPDCGLIVNMTSDTQNTDSIEWLLGDGTTETTSTVTHTYAAPGIYPIQLVAFNNCTSDTAHSSVVLTGSSTLEIIGPPVICSDEPIRLHLQYSGTARLSITWSNGETSSDILITPVDGTTMEVTALGTDGCSFTASFPINFVGVDSIAPGYVPNVFTPNGDTYNEVFEPVVQTGFESLTIFNRWGEELYKTTDTNKPWTGQYKGAPVPDGTYVYFVRWKDACTLKTEERVGHVTLLR
jgi:gliding motility-associated-like protein